MIAVTGSAGFLGQYLIAELHARGHKTKPLTRKELALTTDQLSLELKDCTALIHAAGKVGYHRAQEAEIWESNLALTEKVFYASQNAGLKRFVHVSSIVTLGYGKELRTESSDYNAATLGLAYWDSKRAAEEFLLAKHREGSDCEIAIVNPGTFLGLGEKNSDAASLVRKLSKLWFAVLPKGGSDFIGIQDVARGTVLALEKGRAGERYLLGSENLSYQELHRKIRNTAGKPAYSMGIPVFLLKAIAFALQHLDVARLRRVNGIYLYHDLLKAREELGFIAHPVSKTILEILAQKR